MVTVIRSSEKEECITELGGKCLEKRAVEKDLYPAGKLDLEYYVTLDIWGGIGIGCLGRWWNAGIPLSAIRVAWCGVEQEDELEEH